MSPALANFLFEAANVLLLAAALGWLLFKPVRGALDRERASREKALAEATRLRAEAEAREGVTRTTRAELDRETESQRARILSAARAEAQGIVEEARKAMDAERDLRRREMEAERGAQAGELSGVVGRIAAESVRRLLDAVKGPSLDAALVRAACEELRKLPEPARAGAAVESARPLEAEARGLLREVLGDGFVERTVEELGAGVRVTMAAGQVDASAESLAREFARSLLANGAARDAVEQGGGRG